MNNKIIYYYWMMSDWAYLGAARLEAIARRNDVVVDHRPIRLPDVYARTGGVLLNKRSVQRQNYRIAEMKRWRRRLGIPLKLEPDHFPVNIDVASCMVYAIKSEGKDPSGFSEGVLRAVWKEDRDVSDEEVLKDIAEKVGLDGLNIVQKATSKPCLEAYEKATFDAPADGVFGSPTYIYKGEVFWGQDRLCFLEEALQR